MTTTTHHTASAGHHHSDDPLELRVTTLIAQGRRLAWQLFNTHAKRATYKVEINPPAWKIREELSLLEEELELALSELDRRRI